MLPTQQRVREQLTALAELHLLVHRLPPVAWDAIVRTADEALADLGYDPTVLPDTNTTRAAAILRLADLVR